MMTMDELLAMIPSSSMMIKPTVSKPSFTFRGTMEDALAILGWLKEYAPNSQMNFQGIQEHHRFEVELIFPNEEELLYFKMRWQGKDSIDE